MRSSSLADLPTTIKAFSEPLLSWYSLGLAQGQAQTYITRRMVDRESQRAKKIFLDLPILSALVSKKIQFRSQKIHFLAKLAQKLRPGHIDATSLTAHYIACRSYK